MTMLSQEVHDEMLDISEPHLYDESICSMNFYEYTPQTQANNNTISNPIIITINNQDTYLLPSKSYISIKGQIKRADNNNAYAAADEIALINNAMMYLFTGVKYELGNTMFESINNPGQITSMLGYLSYPDDFSTSSGLKCCWSKDTTNNANSSKYGRSVDAPAAGYILLLKTKIIIKALQLERGFSSAQILEVVLNFTYRLHIFLDLLSIKSLFGD